jgi:hypothetical protein
VGNDVEGEVVADDEGEVGKSGDGEGGVVFLRGRRNGFDDDEVRGAVGGGVGDRVVDGRAGGCDGGCGRDALEGKEGGGGVDADVDEYGRVGGTVSDSALGDSRRRPSRNGTGVGGEGEAEGRGKLARREAVAPVPVVDGTEDVRNSRTDGRLGCSGSGTDEEDGL